MSIQQALCLKTLFVISQTLDSTLVLDQVLDSGVDQVIAVAGAERGFLTLLADDGQMTFRVTRGIDRQEAEDPTFRPAPHGRSGGRLWSASAHRQT